MRLRYRELICPVSKNQLVVRAGSYQPPRPNVMLLLIAGKLRILVLGNMWYTPELGKACYDRLTIPGSCVSPLGVTGVSTVTSAGKQSTYTTPWSPPTRKPCSPI